jgi:hypothetical protein
MCGTNIQGNKKEREEEGGGGGHQDGEHGVGMCMVMFFFRWMAEGGQSRGQSDRCDCSERGRRCSKSGGGDDTRDQFVTEIEGFQDEGKQ